MNQTNRISDIQEIFNLDEELRGDPKFFADQLRQDFTNQTYRRAYVRSVFAYIEGNISLLKRATSQLGEHNNYAFTRADIAVLAEEHYHIENGKAQAKKSKIRWTDNIVYTFNTYAKVHGLSNGFQLNKSNWWSELVKTSSVRDRLMHPKSFPDVRVSDEETYAAEKGLRWFSAELHRLFADTLEIGLPEQRLRLDELSDAEKDRLIKREELAKEARRVSKLAIQDE
jgi:hypothetical protein